MSKRKAKQPTRMKPVLYELPKFEESRFVHDGAGWTAPYLYEQVKENKLRAFRLPLRHIEIGLGRWDGGGSKMAPDLIAYHVKRAMAADLSIPVVMDYQGTIMDGWHRILRALIEDKPYVLCYRFDGYVPPDVKKVDEDNDA